MSWRPYRQTRWPSILLAPADGLMLHGALDPSAFRWRNIRRAIDVLLAGIEAG